MSEINIKFESYDGYKLEGNLIKAEEERAALVFVHGITSSRDELGFHSDYAKFLGENGVSNLRFDYRYQGIYESTLENLTLCGIVNDIEAAFSALKSNVNINLKSFFIIGTSFGGGLTAYWVDNFRRDEIKKVILNAPVINYEDDVLIRNGLLENGMLSSGAQEELNKQGFIVSSDIRFGRGLINELKYINGIKSLQSLNDRVIIFHGDKDEDVPLSSSQKYKGQGTILKIVKDVGHGFGVESDEDLDFPETKAVHFNIYKEALKFIEDNL